MTKHGKPTGVRAHTRAIKEYVVYKRWGKRGGQIEAMVKRKDSPGGLNWRDYLPSDVLAGTLTEVEASTLQEAKKKANLLK